MSQGAWKAFLMSVGRKRKKKRRGSGGEREAWRKSEVGVGVSVLILGKWGVFLMAVVGKKKKKIE